MNLVKKLPRYTLFGTNIVGQYIRDKSSPTSRGRNNTIDSGSGPVIIVGGETFNKGAQAMTFVTVDQVRKRFPEKDIYLFSTLDFHADESEKERYSFDILPWTPGLKNSILADSNLPIDVSDYSQNISQNVVNTLKKSDCIIDINGYALSSQRGFRRSLGYVLNLMIAQKYGVPYYIFPQSIGPFEYSRPEKHCLYPLLKYYLSYPTKIFPREKHGVECLRPFRTDGVDQRFDLVLGNDSYELENIYTDTPNEKQISIEENAVGIVPNQKVVERIGKDKLYYIYSLLVERLVKYEKEIYVFRHSHGDTDICKDLDEIFSANESVTVLSEEYQSFELVDIIEQLDYIIGSRYHSIIHSYKMNTPAFVIGWAVKYRELLEYFNQSQYHFDAQATSNPTALLDAIDEMEASFETESEVISQKRLKLLDKDSVFDEVFRHHEK